MANVSASKPKVHGKKAGLNYTPDPSVFGLASTDPTYSTSLAITPEPVSFSVSSVSPEVESPLEIRQPIAYLGFEVSVEALSPALITAVSTFAVNTESPEVFSPQYITPDYADLSLIAPDPTVIQAVYLYPELVSLGLDTSVDVFAPIYIWTVFSSFQPNTEVPEIFSPIYMSPGIADFCLNTVDPRVVEALYISPDEADLVLSAVDPETITAVYIYAEHSFFAFASTNPVVYSPIRISGIEPASLCFQSFSGSVYSPQEFRNLDSRFSVIVLVKKVVVDAVYLRPIFATVDIETIDPTAVFALYLKLDPSTFVSDAFDPTVLLEFNQHVLALIARATDVLYQKTNGTIDLVQNTHSIGIMSEVSPATLVLDVVRKSELAKAIVTEVIEKDARL
jgi:hypothetical protein